MKRLLMGLAVLPFLSGISSAAQPLTDSQMDKATAGFIISLVERTNFSTTILDINQPTVFTCGSACYLDVQAGFVHVQSAMGVIPIR